MSQKKTHVGFVIDRSGSMGSIRDEIIEAYNEQLQTLREESSKGGDTRVTIVTFGGNYRGKTARLSHNDFLRIQEGSEGPVQVEVRNAKPKDLASLSRDNYNPSGGTPMYDGVGKALNILEREDDGGEDTAFLVVVLSDGVENASREFTGSQIADRVSRLQNTGRWTFVYIGANHDLAEEASHLGFQSGTFVANAQGVGSMSRGLANATTSYMASREAGLTYDASFSETVSEETEDERV